MNIIKGVKKRLYSVSCFQCSGFTIAEMLIVTIIIGILTGIGTRTYYQERDRFKFNGGLVKTMEIIKTTRNFATTSYPVYDPATTKHFVPPDGYGVYIDLNPNTNDPHLIIFANRIGETADQYEDGTDIILEKFRLPKQIDFQSFFLDGTETLYDSDQSKDQSMVIIFTPPLAETYLGDNLSNVDSKKNEIKLEFYNRYVPADSTNEYQCITLNAVKTFPELSSGNCT